MLFESQHSLDENEFRLEANDEMFAFPVHLHRSFEYFEQVSGSMEVIIDDKKYVLNAGDSVLIFPFQIHSYRPIESGKNVICIFSCDMAPDFYKKTANLLPTNNMFRHCLTLPKFTDNLFLKRSVVYNICGEFDRERVYEKNLSKVSNGILADLLCYAENNFNGACLLKDAAVSVGYDYAYLSKQFKKKVGMPFNEYVNLLKVRESQYLLKSTEKSIDEIKDACGFFNLRTFDRVFLKLTGLTPSEYKKQYSN